MRYRTSLEVQDDVFKLLRGSELADEISGNVLLYGTRSRDSKNEDIVVKFVAGLPNQIETGVVAILIYVPDLDFDGEGQYVPDLSRLTTLERKADEWVRKIEKTQSTYFWRLADTIQIYQEEDINQHFITVRIRYRALRKKEETKIEDNEKETNHE